MQQLCSDTFIEYQRDFYNHRWGSVSPVGGPKLARCIGILEEVLGADIRQPRILDLGCGTGWLTNILSAIGPTTGVDLSDGAIDEATARYPAAHFIQADI